MPLAANIEAAISKEVGSASASESAQTSPAPVVDSGAESAPADGINQEPAQAGEPPRPSAGADVQKTKHELLREKLAAAREERAAKRLSQEAKADREAAAAERQKFEGLKNGTFLDTIKALGKDPREVFEEMKREAIEAGKPEAQIRIMRQRFDAQLKEALESVKKETEPLKSEVERLRREKEDLEAREKERELMTRFSSDFSAQIKSDDYRDLRVEYGEERLLGMVRSFLTKPEALQHYARQYKVDLTHDDGRFSMREALTVLKRAHAEHEEQKSARAKSSSAPSQAAPAQADKQPTVNGTRAENPLGNSPASARSSNDSPKKPRLSRKERIERLVNGGS